MQIKSIESVLLEMEELEIAAGSEDAGVCKETCAKYNPLASVLCGRLLRFYANEVSRPEIR